MAITNIIKPDLHIILAAPRGFCAGVDRAILIVNKALEKYGAPVYVRHEIVHNKTVVRDLEAKGTVFIDDIDEIPNEDIQSGRPVIFSAHGVPKSVPESAQKINLLYIDATCPLVSKVHREVEHLYTDGYHIILIGHAGHPEVIGTMGQIPNGYISLIENMTDAESFIPPPQQKLAYVTQTTLSVFDTKNIIDILQHRFPDIAKPKKEDICYATTNRQYAVSKAIKNADLLLVLGAANSSNSRRLADLANNSDCTSYLIDDVYAIDWAWLHNVKKIAITAGASAPESLVQDVIIAFQQKYHVTIEQIDHEPENVVFKLPYILRETA